MLIFCQLGKTKKCTNKIQRQKNFQVKTLKANIAHANKYT